jgi:hypothetical protein
VPFASCATARSVVVDAQRGDAALAHARDRHGTGAGVERVLHQLGERLAWVGLRTGEPADQLEGVGGAQPARPDLV